MRDRLIELIANADSCCQEPLADYLLENGIILPPCKIGDTAYEITSNVPNNIKESKVVAFVIATDGTIGIKTDYSFPLTREIGRMTFLTREEAEQALKEGVQND